MRRKRRGLTRAERRAKAEQAGVRRAQAANQRTAKREVAAQTTEKLSAALHTAEHTHLDRLVKLAYQNGPDLTFGDLNRKLVDDFLRTVLAKRPRLADRPYVWGLVYLAQAPWSHEPADWRPEGSGSLAAIRSLAQHLLGPYQIPYFLVDSLLDGWFNLDDGVHQLRTAALIGRGDSLYRDGRGYFVPLTLTRRMCHELLRTPTDLYLDEGVRRAQVLGYGGSEALARAIISRMGHVRDEEFMAEVIRWLCQTDRLDPTQFASLFRYLEAMKLENPEYSLRGRSWCAVVRAMRAWRQDQALVERLECSAAYARQKQPTQFAPSGFAGYKWSRPRRHKGRVVEQIEWTVSEILTARDLVSEGREMMHCVTSYARYIHKGQSSIWSLQLNGRRCLTIEVHNEPQQIAQLCGKKNRPPRPQEYAILLAWAKLNGLTIMPPP
jgi:hypothetical protein